MRYVVIMAGGAGTRLWPLSRQGTPKQLLPLFAGRSLLRMAFERARALVPIERIMVVTGATHAAAVREILPELGAANLLGEPVGRDSLGAVAWPAAVLAHRDPDAVIAHVTADHIIEPLDPFVASLTEAFEIAERVPDVLVTLGVVPTSPHPGYGYLHQGEPLDGFADSRIVVEFREKPDVATAERYLESGEYWWNSGMFVWRAQTLLAQLAVLVPEMYQGVQTLAERPDTLAHVFPTLPKTSVDYGIMEPTSRGHGAATIVAVPLTVSWRDVGGFAALAESLGLDPAGNATEGLVVTLDAHDNLILNTAGRGHVIAASGISGMVVVHTPTATLVTTLAGAEQVRKLVEKVGVRAGPEFT